MIDIKTATKGMTEGNCMKLLVQFFLPILAGNFFQQFYNFVDSVIVGKGIGDAALAAVGNTGSVHFFILGFMIGLTGGLGIYISQSFGAQDYGKMRQETAMSVLICLGIGVLVTILSLLTMRPIFTFLNTPQDMMQDTISYFRIILIGSTVTVCNNFAMTLLRCVGNSRVPLIAMILSSIINVILDVLFVFPGEMGVSGAALATVLAQVFSLLYCYLYIRKIKELQFTASDWKIRTNIVKYLMLKGMPVAVMNSVTAFGGMILQYFVNAMGTLYVAAYAACMKLCSLFEQAGGAVGLAVLTFTGQNYGANKINRIRRGVWDGILLSTLINIPICLVQLIIPETLTRLMLNDPIVISYTREFLFITGIAIFPLGWLFVTRNACQGLGKTFVPMLSGVLEVVMRVVTGFLLVARMGFQRVAIAEVSAWCGAAVMLCVTYVIYVTRLCQNGIVDSKQEDTMTVRN